MDSKVTINTNKTITSMEVAEMVGKEHNMLLRDIRRYIEQLGQSKIAQSNFFTESTYKNKQNKEQPCYNVTKKGCEFIAHKLTGIKGTAFTARYINRFHDMEKELKPKSPAEMLVVYANQLLENEHRMNTIESKVNEINAKITTHNEDYFTIAGYASLRGVNIDTSKANMLGRKAAKLSREYGYDIGKVTDSRFGKVNSYHLDILKSIFEFVGITKGA